MPAREGGGMKDEIKRNDNGGESPEMGLKRSKSGDC